MASPHTRGWTGGGEAGQPAAGGFPAHAGMDRTRIGRHHRRRRLPRTRGDGPRMRLVIPASSAASPHTRGWTLHLASLMPPRRGFPAHAGMDPAVLPVRHAGRRLPRTRGDGPSLGRGRGRMTLASPHTRGWTRLPLAPLRPKTGFPAHAGMDPRGGNRRRPTCRLPRTRGDGPRAEAGGRRQASRGRGRLPRTRGDGPSGGRMTLRAAAASPHTRGWTRSPRRPSRRASGFPAHAGMDPLLRRRRRAAARLPRTRGDGPISLMLSWKRPTASPHTRGWTRPQRPNKVGG